MAKGKKEGWPPPSPFEREPIGYEIKAEGDNWVAFLIRAADDEYGGSCIPLATGRSESMCRLRAERAVRRELARFKHERSAIPDKVYLQSDGSFR